MKLANAVNVKMIIIFFVVNLLSSKFLEFNLLILGFLDIG